MLWLCICWRLVVGNKNETENNFYCFESYIIYKTLNKNGDESFPSSPLVWVN